MDAKKLEEFLSANAQPKFRLKQILAAVFQNNIFDYQGVTTLPKDLKETLATEVPIFSFKKSFVLKSKDGLAHKAVLNLQDDANIETVLLQPKPGQWSICVSSQVGCVYHCAFCATGASGFKRNLTSEEITDQVLFWKKYLLDNHLEPNVFHSIIFMGMGEPMANLNNLTRAIASLTDPEQFGLSERKISVSTSTSLPTILVLTKQFPQISLAISLHSADQNSRQRLMPQTKTFSLAQLTRLLTKYFQTHRRKVFLEYLLIKNVTDTTDQIYKLVKWIKGLDEPALLHVNLIPYNSTTDEFQTSPKEKLMHIKNQLLREHILVTVRKSLGADIAGACGQLAAKTQP